MRVGNAGGDRLPTQLRVLDRHAGGAARTVRVHFQPNGVAPFTLSHGPGAPVGPVDGPLYDPGTGVIDNGRFRLQVRDGNRGVGLQVGDRGGGGRRWSFCCEVDPWTGGSQSSAGREGSLQVEENGPLWCSLRICGSFGGALEYQLRLQVARDVPMLWWQCRFGNMSEDPVKIRAARCVLATVAVDTPCRLVCDAEDRATLHDGAQRRELSGESVPGYLAARSGDLELAWGMRDLAAQFPKALAADDGRLVWAILPPDVPPARLRFVHDGNQRGHWFDDDGGLRLPPCFSWRTDGFLAWGPDADDLADLAGDPPLVRPVALPGSPWGQLIGAEDLPAAVQREAERLCASYESTQRAGRLFGMMDVGDLIGPAPSNDPPGQVWMNGEHDGSCGPLLYYLVSGQRRFWTAGHHTARHQIDIDLRRRGDSWALAKHCAGHVTDRCENGHFWLEGLAHYYRLTGDADALEAVDHLGAWLAQDLAASVAGDFPTLREAGVSLWMLAVAGELFPERGYYLDILVPHVDAMLALQREDGSWHPYLKTDVALCRHPGYRKSMHLVSLAMGLMRYGQASNDERIPPVLYRFLQRSLVEGELLLPGGDGLIWDNSFALELDEDEPGLEPAEIDAAAFLDGQAAGYTNRWYGQPAASGGAPQPWDPALFPLLEVTAYVGRYYPDPKLLGVAAQLLERYLARVAGAGLDTVRSFRSWTPLLQHLPAYLAFLQSPAAPDPGRDRRIFS